MDAQRILNNLRTVAETSDGVERLRALIVDLAVRGRLSTRYEGDAIFDAPGLHLEAADDRPSDLPSTWSWTTLESLGPPGERTTADGPFGSKLKSSHYVYRSGYRVIRLGNIGLGVFKEADQSFVDGEHFRSLGAYHLRSGDMVVASLGSPCGRASIVPDSALPALHKADCFRVRLHPSINKRFVLFVLNSPMTLTRAAELNRGDTRGRINLSHLKGTRVPIPPRAEQDRIVAKVDGLMRLCDDLEARQQARDHVITRLRASTLDALTSAETDDDLQTAWSRVHTNWESLTDHSDSIDALRRTILQLAIRGRLVGQLSSEEHPTVALDRCAEERNRLISEGRFRRQSPIPDRVEVPFELPRGWEWTQIDDCFLVAGGIQKSSKRRPAGNSFPYLRVANVQRGHLNLEEIEEFELFRGELDRYQLEPGDLLVVEGNGSESQIGRCARWSGEIDECVHQNHLIRCRPLDRDIEAFTLLYLNSPTGTAVMRRLAVTTSGLYNLSVGKIRAISMPLPPREEQQRIVSRVGELMNLCDSLERALAKESRAGEALAASTTRILPSS